MIIHDIPWYTPFKSHLTLTSGSIPKFWRRGFGVLGITVVVWAPNHSFPTKSLPLRRRRAQSRCRSWTSEGTQMDSGCSKNAMVFSHVFSPSQKKLVNYGFMILQKRHGSLVISRNFAKKPGHLEPPKVPQGSARFQGPRHWKLMIQKSVFLRIPLTSRELCRLKWAQKKGSTGHPVIKVACLAMGTPANFKVIKVIKVILPWASPLTWQLLQAQAPRWWNLTSAVFPSAAGISNHSWHNRSPRNGFGFSMLCNPSPVGKSPIRGLYLSMFILSMIHLYIFYNIW